MDTAEIGPHDAVAAAAAVRAAGESPAVARALRSSPAPVRSETEPVPVFVPRKDQIPVLDGLRAVAVLLVIWSHCSPVTGRTPLAFLNYLLQPDYLGVDIFFVLSGFLITRILLANKLRRRPVTNFLIRRLLRIFPIYYLALVVVGLLHPGRYFGWCAVYLSNFYFPFQHHPGRLPMAHTWSLAVEEHFYLFWPWIVYGLPIRKSRSVVLWGFLPLAVASAVVFIAIRQFAPGHSHFPAGRLIYMATMCRASSLALGALFAFHESWLRASLSNVRTVSACLFAAAVIILPLGEFTNTPLLPLAKMVGFSLLCGAILATTIGLRDSERWVARLLRGAVFTFVGRISYGLYLYHVPIFNQFGLVLGDQAPVHAGVLAVVATFLVATTSYYLIEQPILRLKERFE
jgi:peptidoglycan/LPS O-acetylase OafA/YrhL